MNPKNYAATRGASDGSAAVDRETTELDALRQENARLKQALSGLVDSADQADSEFDRLMAFENEHVRAGLAVIQSDLSRSVDDAKRALNCAGLITKYFESLDSSVGSVKRDLGGAFGIVLGRGEGHRRPVPVHR